ncbi:MAG: hypothetical protein NC548_52895, partial [Lachnospiraceae bacterium]|nr:hypothetical protein [Lachnospiraceae bacterium]
ATPYRLNSAVQYLDKDGKQHFRPKDEEGSEKFDDKLAKRELTMETRCVLKFLTRTRPRVFHDVVYQVDISTLLERGYLAKVEYFDLSVVDQSRLKRNSTGMDFDDRSLSNEFKLNNFGQYLLEIVNRLRSPKNGVPRRGILVFTKYIDECEALCKHLPSCAIVTGSTPKREREEILDNFKAGCIEVLLNIGVLTTGFDYPELDTVVMARPTMSLALYYQIVGRGIRPHPSKKSTWFVDLCGNIKRFGKVEDLHLSEPNPGEYIITGKADGCVKQLTNIYF